MNNLFPEATHKVLALAGRSPLDKAKGYGKLSEVVEGMLHFLLLIDEDFSFQRLCEHPRYPWKLGRELPPSICCVHFMALAITIASWPWTGNPSGSERGSILSPKWPQNTGHLAAVKLKSSNCWDGGVSTFCAVKITKGESPFVPKNTWIKEHYNCVWYVFTYFWHMVQYAISASKFVDTWDPEIQWIQCFPRAYASGGQVHIGTAAQRLGQVDGSKDALSHGINQWLEDVTQKHGWLNTSDPGWHLQCRQIRRYKTSRQIKCLHRDICVYII